MKNFKTKAVSVMLSALLICTAFAGCATNKNDTGDTTGGADTASAAINVISRESGSGTRGAFIELFGIEEKDADGNKIDKTVDTAAINSSTGVVITTVAGDKNAIGYISLGALSDKVKAVKIDGAEPSVENVKNGSYKVSRPFNIVTKDNLSAQSQDFINFILSKEGQEVVGKNGYIANDGAKDYESTNPKGKIVVAGSSSVTPLMEKLKEAYVAKNKNVEIEIQQSDSSSGVKSAVSGVCDIGMVSRELKDSEIAEGVNPTVIATDGIAVIVNPENPMNELSTEQVKAIYTGAAEKWSDVK